VVPTLEQLQQQQASLGKVDNLLVDASYLSEQNINASDKGQITHYISTIEPTFGIIKHVLGFRQFLLRGVDAVNGEWDLVCIGYNMKKMFALSA
jgi:hypothetical protein